MLKHLAILIALLVGLCISSFTVSGDRGIARRSPQCS